MPLCGRHRCLIPELRGPDPARHGSARWAVLGVALVAAAVAAVALWPHATGPELEEAEAPAPRDLGRRAPAPVAPAPPKGAVGSAASLAAASPSIDTAPTPTLAEDVRKRMLLRIACAMSEVAEPLKKNPTPEALARTRQAIDEARQLVRQAPGTPEARQARYHAFRYLQLLGEHNLSEVEFQTYTGEVAVAEGVAAACKMLYQEGEREKWSKNYVGALNRFQSILTFAAEGEMAARASVGIGSIHAWLHRRDLAEPAFRKALALGAPASEARRCYRYLVNVEVCSRDYEQALRDAQALLALPTSGAARARDEALLGRVLEKTAGPIKAAEHYRQITKRYPSEDCAAAKSRLRRLEKRIEDAVLEPIR